ncbi:MAG: hypothetical protein JWM87_3681 [Candidatus Eremiobacteraeota bacterium]|nr:hypothetical protein [Candidatus Eremiobacteraeota bacterium]
MTIVPAPIPFDTLLSRSWALFRRNWIVALPPVIAGLITIAGAVVFAVIATVAVLASGPRHPSATLGGTFVVSYFGFVALVLVVTLWGYTAMFGMAGAAWERGTATFGDGFAAFRSRGGAVIVAAIGVFGLAIAAVILAIPTLLVSLLALPLLVMYVMPSVISGGRGGFEAIGESVRLVRRFFGPSVITLLVLLAIWYGISFVGAFFILPLEFAVMPQGADVMPRMPPIGLAVFSGIGYVLSILASMAYSGFFALAVVGLYRDLAPRAAASPLPPAPAGMPAP